MKREINETRVRSEIFLGATERRMTDHTHTHTELMDVLFHHFRRRLLTSAFTVQKKARKHFILLIIFVISFLFRAKSQFYR